MTAAATRRSSPCRRRTRAGTTSRTSTDIPEFTRKEIEHFFEHYKDLEPGKWVKTEGWGDAAEAEAIIQAGIAAYVPHEH